MADETLTAPPPAAAPAEPAQTVPLEQASLAEYVQRRARGERPGPAAHAPPKDTPPDDQTPEPETPDSEPPPAAAAPQTPEQAAAAKASRTRGELQRRLDSLQAQLGYQTRQNEKLQKERDEYLARAA